MSALVRRLIGSVPRGWGRFLLALVLASAASLSSVALMGVSGWLLSRAAEHPPVMYLTAAAVLVRAFGISRGVARYTERLVGHDLGLRLQSALRLDTYRALARTTLLGRRRGDLLTRVVADVDAVLDAVVRVAIPFLSGLFVLLAASAVVSVFSWPAAVALLASALIAGVAAPWLAARISSRADEAAISGRGALADAVHEVGRTATDLVAYSAQDRALARVAAADDALRGFEERAAWTRGLATGIQTLAAGASVMATLALGAAQVRAGDLDHTMLAVLVLLPLALHEVFADFTKAAQTHTRSRVALARVTEILTAEPVGRGDLDASPTDEAPRVSVRDLTLGWPGAEPLLGGLSFEVAAGESLAIVGPSGVGKTTLAATLLGLIPPAGGSVETRGRIGYLAQDAHIFSTSVAENVMIGDKTADRPRVEEALARVRLDVDPDRAVGELGASLSGGEERRLALSRLVVGDYQILVLDEPTEHLDAETATALLDDIWAQAAGSPLLVITHDPDVRSRCDRELVLG
ncbi:MAG TPA: thiol reductant ABC exporter subunit CydC [Propioniciclava sp.]|jgi:ATP-binding cassette subfamily C protein CydC|uniref:thiol reductant ABC exporter subunit CydC n=1 Tax=Propioniciclava sp. TaxID=2038686 RepID=UPI002BC1F248|nr:thiol reductant ABC exporter subunit CydC [Propioniciclava sp.]HRL49459.1 thiol reductant ABC exporter subunit CydC [Propioniciclava sp.]HRL80433.1 thiol reductant ABC exporter subunit CydC [Propioniciclava sp.]